MPRNKFHIILLFTDVIESVRDRIVGDDISACIVNGDGKNRRRIDIGLFGEIMVKF